MSIKRKVTIYPVSFHVQSDLWRAAAILSLAEASDRIVVDDDRHFIGILSEDNFSASRNVNKCPKDPRK